MPKEIITDISSGINNIIDDLKIKDSIERVILNNNYNSYSSPKGIKNLRIKITELIDHIWKFKINPSNMIITTGSQQSLNLIADMLLDVNDCIAIEQPTYFGAIKLFRRKTNKIINIDINENGINLKKLEESIIKFRPKLIYVVPTFNNPTGYSWSNANRKQFLKIINKYNIIIIEDDPYSLINFTKNKYHSLYKLNNGKNIIYLGTFSKYISPAINIGYIVASKDIIDKLYDYKETYDLCTSLFNQYVILDYLNHNNLVNDINKKISIYINKFNCLLKQLKLIDNNITYTIPKGGIFFSINTDKILSKDNPYYFIMNNKKYLRINICTDISDI